MTTGDFTINGLVQGDLTGGITLVQGQSWQVQTGVIVNNGQITFQNIGTSGFRGLSGVQIVNAIPEPSTAFLFGGAVIACVLRRRR